MKYITIALISFLFCSIISCKKDQTCICTKKTIATADDEVFPLYEPTLDVTFYEKKLKDNERFEWCESYEYDTTYNGFKDGYNFIVEEETTCKP